MRVLTLDFWNTLYRHRYTAAYRAQIRAQYLLEYCHKRDIQEPERLSSTFFDVIDGFIRNTWREGVCPVRPAILEHAVTQYDNLYTRETIQQVLEELNHIYAGVLKPELYSGAAEFLLWAQSGLSLYIISDTYILRGDTLDEVLDADGIKRLFRGRYYSDAIGFEKPNVAAMQSIIAAERVSANDIVHVGDLLERDYELAKRIGCRFILLTHNSEPNINSSIDDQILLGHCDSFATLRSIIERI